MKTQDPGRWPTTIVALHWLTALAVMTAFALVLGREFAEEKPIRQALLTWHRAAGILAFVLTLARIPMRAIAAAPDHGLSKVMRAVSAGGHGLLYLGLLALPMFGYALSCARAGEVNFLGVALPVLLERDRDLAETLEGIHGNMGWVLLALIGLHAAVALWHHHFLKDRVLTAMLPRR